MGIGQLDVFVPDVVKLSSPGPGIKQHRNQKAFLSGLTRFVKPVDISFTNKIRRFVYGPSIKPVCQVVSLLSSQSPAQVNAQSSTNIDFGGLRVCGAPIAFESAGT